MLVSMFKIDWKTPQHNIMVEFLNNQKLDLENNKIKVMLGEEQRIVDKHLLGEVFQICHIREIEPNPAKMYDVRVTLADITDRVPNTYNTNERWVEVKIC